MHLEQGRAERHIALLACQMPLPCPRAVWGCMMHAFLSLAAHIHGQYCLRHLRWCCHHTKVLAGSLLAVLHHGNLLCPSELQSGAKVLLPAGTSCTARFLPRSARSSVNQRCQVLPSQSPLIVWQAVQPASKQQQHCVLPSFLACLAIADLHHECAARGLQKPLHEHQAMLSSCSAADPEATT